jgi:hypothetical protein
LKSLATRITIFKAPKWEREEPTIVLSVDRRVNYGLFLRLFAIAQECCSRLRLVYQPLETHEVIEEL